MFYKPSSKELTPETVRHGYKSEQPVASVRACLSHSGQVHPQDLAQKLAASFNRTTQLRSASSVLTSDQRRTKPRMKHTPVLAPEFVDNWFTQLANPSVPLDQLLFEAEQNAIPFLEKVKDMLAYFIKYQISPIRSAWYIKMALQFRPNSHTKADLSALLRNFTKGFVEHVDKSMQQETSGGSTLLRTSSAGVPTAVLKTSAASKRKEEVFPLDALLSFANTWVDEGCLDMKYWLTHLIDFTINVPFHPERSKRLHSALAIQLKHIAASEQLTMYCFDSATKVFESEEASLADSQIAIADMKRVVGMLLRKRATLSPWPMSASATKQLRQHLAPAEQTILDTVFHSALELNLLQGPDRQRLCPEGQSLRALSLHLSGQLLQDLDAPQQAVKEAKHGLLKRPGAIPTSTGARKAPTTDQTPTAQLLLDSVFGEQWLGFMEGFTSQHVLDVLASRQHGDSLRQQLEIAASALAPELPQPQEMTPSMQRHNIVTRYICGIDTCLSWLHSLETDDSPQARQAVSAGTAIVSEIMYQFVKSQMTSDAATNGQGAGATVSALIDCVGPLLLSAIQKGTVSTNSVIELANGAICKQILCATSFAQLLQTHLDTTEAKELFNKHIIVGSSSSSFTACRRLSMYGLGLESLQREFSEEVIPALQLCEKLCQAAAALQPIRPVLTALPQVDAVSNELFAESEGDDRASSRLLQEHTKSDGVADAIVFEALPKLRQRQVLVWLYHSVTCNGAEPLPLQSGEQARSRLLLSTPELVFVYGILESGPANDLCLDLLSWLMNRVVWDIDSDITETIITTILLPQLAVVRCNEALLFQVCATMAEVFMATTDAMLEGQLATVLARLTVEIPTELRQQEEELFRTVDEKIVAVAALEACKLMGPSEAPPLVAQCLNDPTADSIQQLFSLSHRDQLGFVAEVLNTVAGISSHGSARLESDSTYLSRLLQLALPMFGRIDQARQFFVRQMRSEVVRRLAKSQPLISQEGAVRAFASLLTQSVQSGFLTLSTLVHICSSVSGTKLPATLSQALLLTCSDMFKTDAHSSNHSPRCLCSAALLNTNERQKVFGVVSSLNTTDRDLMLRVYNGCSESLWPSSPEQKLAPALHNSMFRLVLAPLQQQGDQGGASADKGPTLVGEALSDSEMKQVVTALYAEATPSTVLASLLPVQLVLQAKSPVSAHDRRTLISDGVFTLISEGGVRANVGIALSRLLPASVQEQLAWKLADVMDPKAGHAVSIHHVWLLMACDALALDKSKALQLVLTNVIQTLTQASLEANGSSYFLLVRNLAMLCTSLLSPTTRRADPDSLLQQLMEVLPLLLHQLCKLREHELAAVEEADHDWAERSHARKAVLGCVGYIAQHIEWVLGTTSQVHSTKHHKKVRHTVLNAMAHADLGLWHAVYRMFESTSLVALSLVPDQTPRGKTARLKAQVLPSRPGASSIDWGDVDAHTHPAVEPSQTSLAFKLAERLRKYQPVLPPTTMYAPHLMPNPLHLPGVESMSAAQMGQMSFMMPFPFPFGNVAMNQDSTMQPPAKMPYHSSGHSSELVAHLHTS
eukprot:m.266895 g.266895  ORF g.266895 m.266895 type:complete len:1555 (-) comp15634_c2_seq2:560-5224(-)